MIDSEAPTDPPRATPVVPGTIPDFDSQPLSVALSLLKSKLAGGADSPRGDGTPESVNFDLPDPDGPPPGLPGLIDTGPPGLFSDMEAQFRAAELADEAADAPPSTPKTTPKRPTEPVTPRGTSDRPTPRSRPAPPAFVATAAPVNWHAPPLPAGPLLAPPPAPPSRLAVALSSFLRTLSRLANRVLPGLGGTLPDAVQVSVFGPRHLEPGKTVRLQVYAHPADAFASVCTLSRALQPDSEVLAVGQIERPVKRGEQIGLHLSVRNGGLARSLTAFTWQGKPKAEPFELLVPWESPAGRTPAALTVGLNNVQAGRVAFELSVLPRSG